MPTYVNEFEMLPKLTGHSGHSSDMQDLRHRFSNGQGSSVPCKCTCEKHFFNVPPLVPRMQCFLCADVADCEALAPQNFAELWQLVADFEISRQSRKRSKLWTFCQAITVLQVPDKVVPVFRKK